MVPCLPEHNGLFGDVDQAASPPALNAAAVLHVACLAAEVNPHTLGGEAWPSAPPDELEMVVCVRHNLRVIGGCWRRGAGVTGGLDQSRHVEVGRGGE